MPFGVSAFYRDFRRRAVSDLLFTIENENDRKLTNSLSQPPLYLTAGKTTVSVLRRAAGAAI